MVDKQTKEAASVDAEGPSQSIEDQTKEVAQKLEAVALSPAGTKIVKTRDPNKPLDIKEVQQLHQDTFGMPKIELHAHIGGCFRPTTFLELAEKEGADLDKLDFYKVDLEIAFEFFKIGSKIVKDLPTLQRVTYEIIEDYNKQNTRYLELRSTPKEMGGKSKDDYVQAILEVMKQAEIDFPRIVVRYLLSVNRTAGVDAAKETISLAAKHKEASEFVVGIELSGDPRAGAFSDFESVFEQARSEHKLKISLHCAETEEQMEEAQSMIDFKPDRLGHCCFLTEKQLHQVHDLNIPTEICPTSNLAVVKEAAKLVQALPHLNTLLELDHNIIICCDDTMLFSTNHSTEFFEFANAFQMTGGELKQMLLRNVDAIFDDGKKQWLTEQIEGYRM